jgi:site-specific DNA recombinase
MSRAASIPVGRKGTLRCAIYTRKSSEEGLEQEFNSLDAQREACQAFIQSQRHEGWSCLPAAYDDGGVSGATMVRPALQKLLADIRAGGIDVVVVYKIDRLTRSLADFAKITETFDAKGVSFVSVTQQFNTTTSMGRLTLNVLLSFAQFEREVTGERIRDKIAASKKKGMWMGGTPPLGYEAKDRKLVVNEREAKTVRYIFRRYGELGSVRLLQQELEAHGITSKCWTSASGHRWGGKPIARGALYLMLRNRIYHGEIVHKDKHYPAEHAAIIEPALWDKVQTRLASNAVDHSTGERARNPSLLAGLLFDGEDNPMTPTHAVKRGVRYRYYVSRPLITGGRADAPTGRRLPATEIERIVARRLCQWLCEPANLLAALAPQALDAIDQQQLTCRARALADGWPELTPARSRAILMALIERIEVHPDRVDIHLVSDRLGTILRGGTFEPASSCDAAMRKPVTILSVPARLRRAGLEMKLVIDGLDPYAAPTKPDPSLIKLIVRAHALRERLVLSGGRQIVELAESEKLGSSYFTRVVRLAYLAPDITNAILEGRHPRDLTAEKLLNGSRLPALWSDQRKALAFS